MGFFTAENHFHTFVQCLFRALCRNADIATHSLAHSVLYKLDARHNFNLGSLTHEKPIPNEWHSQALLTFGPFGPKLTSSLFFLGIIENIILNRNLSFHVFSDNQGLKTDQIFFGRWVNKHNVTHIFREYSETFERNLSICYRRGPRKLCHFCFLLFLYNKLDSLAFLLLKILNSKHLHLLHKMFLFNFILHVWSSKLWQDALIVIWTYPYIVCNCVFWGAPPSFLYSSILRLIFSFELLVLS